MDNNNDVKSNNNEEVKTVNINSGFKPAPTIIKTTNAVTGPLSASEVIEETKEAPSVPNAPMIELTESNDDEEKNKKIREIIMYIVMAIIVIIILVLGIKFCSNNSNKGKHLATDYDETSKVVTTVRTTVIETETTTGIETTVPSTEETTAVTTKNVGGEARITNQSGQTQTTQTSQSQTQGTTAKQTQAPTAAPTTKQTTKQTEATTKQDVYTFSYRFENNNSEMAIVTLYKNGSKITESVVISYSGGMIPGTGEVSVALARYDITKASSITFYYASNSSKAYTATKA